MRMRGAANASARSSERDAILLTRTFVRTPPRVSRKSGSTPNCVMLGPRLIATTCAGAPKEARVSSINRARCWMKSSLMDGALPRFKMSLTLGNVQWMTFAPLVVRVGCTAGTSVVVTCGMALGSIGVKSSVEADAGSSGERGARGLFSNWRSLAISGVSQKNKSRMGLSRKTAMPKMIQASMVKKVPPPPTHAQR